jgi:hypothetical protein
MRVGEDLEIRKAFRKRTVNRTGRRRRRKCGGRTAKLACALETACVIAERMMMPGPKLIEEWRELIGPDGG